MYKNKLIADGTPPALAGPAAQQEMATGATKILVLIKNTTHSAVLPRIFLTIQQVKLLMAQPLNGMKIG